MLSAVAFAPMSRTWSHAPRAQAALPYGDAVIHFAADVDATMDRELETFMRAACWLVLAGAALSSCSATLEFEECSTNDDCAGRGAGMVCTADHFCVDQSSLVSEIPLTTKECGSVFGPVGEPGTVLFGTLLPTSGDNGAIGIPIEQAVILGVKEFNEHGGLGGGRKLAVLLCDTGGNSDKGLAAAQHLVSLGVPAAVGPAFSGVAIEVASKYAAPSAEHPNGLVLISPSATNPAITTLSDQDRVWRTVPSDALQGKAMAHVIQNGAGYGLPTFGRITVVYKDDAYGTGLLTTLVESLPTSGGPALSSVKYADPTKEKVYASDLFAKVDESNPDLVVMIGTAETAKILPYFEYAWRDRAAPVHWLLADGSKTDSLFAEVDVLPDGIDKQGILQRIRGTAPRGGSGAHFNAFKARLAGEFGYPEPPVYTAQAYDATYMLGLALGASSKAFPSSADVVAGLKRLTGGAKLIPAGPSSITEALQILQSSGVATIDFDGASGTLEFGADGEAPGPIELWAPKDGAFAACDLLAEDGQPVDPAAGGCDEL